MPNSHIHGLDHIMISYVMGITGTTTRRCWTNTANICLAVGIEPASVRVLDLSSTCDGLIYRTKKLFKVSVSCLYFPSHIMCIRFLTNPTMKSRGLRDCTTYSH